MTSNEELKKLMAEIPLTQAQVAEYAGSASVETVKGWCSTEGCTRYRVLPTSKLRLLKFELADRRLK